jgi:hypothetical protein
MVMLFILLFIDVFMPLTVLMDYFNEQLQLNARTRSLPATGFYKASDMFGARFGSLTFGSHFFRIIGPDGKHVIGYDSETLVRSATGNELDIDEVYGALDEPEHIIQLDRLVRTLHSLNYLQRFSGNGILSLKVHPRHITSVGENYGKVFEAILSDCGLGPERVLLHTRLLSHASLPRFQQAFFDYRERGYQLGVNVRGPEDLALLHSLELEPDVIFVHVPESADRWQPPLSSLKIFSKSRHYLVTTDESSPHAQISEFDGSVVRFRHTAHLINA